MQPGAEYIVILNDPALRDAFIREHQRAERARRTAPVRRTASGLLRLIHVLAALRSSLARPGASRRRALAEAQRG